LDFEFFKRVQNHFLLHIKISSFFSDGLYTILSSYFLHDALLCDEKIRCTSHLTEGRGGRKRRGRGAKSYDEEKALPTINHLILSGGD
jgi:hypothetical protein